MFNALKSLFKLQLVHWLVKRHLVSEKVASEFLHWIQKCPQIFRISAIEPDVLGISFDKYASAENILAKKNMYNTVKIKISLKKKTSIKKTQKLGRKNLSMWNFVNLCFSGKPWVCVIESGSKNSQ